VSHAGSIRAALADWLGIAGDGVFRIDQRTASVNVVDWVDGTPIVRLLNGTHPG
jgi:broad specificity phosphatase PhoE